MCSCNTRKEVEIPEHLREFDNVTVYPYLSDTELPYRITFEEEQSFGDTNDVYFQRMDDIAIDEWGRVLIVESATGSRAVHVFEANGHYLARIGEQGDGPGEYQTSSHIQAVSNRLYLYDNANRRLSVYSLDTFSFLHAVLLQSGQTKEIKELEGTIPEKIFVRNDDTFLIGFADPPIANDHSRNLYYYQLTSRGDLVPKRMLRQRAEWILGVEINGRSFTTMLPFIPKPLLTLSDDGDYYSASSEELFVKVHNSSGEYIRAFYYPFSNRVLDRISFLNGLTNETARRIYRQVEMPETWPAMEDLLIDNQNRLWISTIVEDDDVYEWCVLQHTGELITRFT